MNSIIMNKLTNRMAFKSIVFQIVITFFVWTVNSFIPSYSSESVFILEVILSQMLVYFSDILFIQENFMKKGYSLNQTPNTLYEKFLYSIDKNIFYKFIVIVTISTIINNSIYNYILGQMDKRKLFMNKKELRNPIVQIIVNIFTTISYVNIMKFKWAYVNNEDPVLNMIIISWFSLSILISVSKCANT
jgi:hypothetical protein